MNNEWLAWVKRLMIWLSSLLGSSCAWSFRSEHHGDHRWKIHGLVKQQQTHNFQELAGDFWKKHGDYEIFVWWIFWWLLYSWHQPYEGKIYWFLDLLRHCFYGGVLRGPPSKRLTFSAFNPWTTLMSQKFIPFFLPNLFMFQVNHVGFQGITSYKPFHKG